MDDTSSTAEFSRLAINKTRVSTRRTSEGLLLFHAPSARVVRLEADGEKIWTKIESGIDSITQLVNEYQIEAGVTAEAAAFKIVGFLDELRSEDFVQFSMPEQTVAPLLDVTIDSPTPLEFQKAAAEDDVALQARGKSEVTLRVARPSLTLAEIAKLATAELGARIGIVHRLKILDLEPGELSGRVASKLATQNVAPESGRDRRFLELENPASNLSLADLQDQQLRKSSMQRRVSRRIIVIVVITDGPIIIIVIDDGPGPTFGRSRNACKTVCV
ncbi:hypothetical protein [Streptomyces sp. NBC_01451]|uniref:hypothetical protein n=1 Tax=Streptomyces sp. NBC_01451 TaxID=2903872 RepID=UPI002E326E62|nr:hypothetical protein [Streptomyces sp. NBC_01451]